MSRRSILLATTICAVIATAAAVDHAFAHGGGEGGFHSAGGAFRFSGANGISHAAISSNKPALAPIKVELPSHPVYKAGSGVLLKSTLPSGSINHPTGPASPPAASPATTSAPAINLSRLPASPNAPANLGNALHPAAPAINVSRIPAAPNAPVNLGERAKIGRAGHHYSAEARVPQRAGEPGEPRKCAEIDGAGRHHSRKSCVPERAGQSRRLASGEARKSRRGRLGAGTRPRQPGRRWSDPGRHAHAHADGPHESQPWPDPAGHRNQCGGRGCVLLDQGEVRVAGR